MISTHQPTLPSFWAVEDSFILPLAVNPSSGGTMPATVAAPPAVTPASSTGNILLIDPAVQTYDWGRFGLESEVAQLQEAAGKAVDPAKPYAELWMGTHPSGPSTVADGAAAGTPLLAHIRDHPEVLGDALPAFGVDLPFLFKVLSVRTALSIQSHPDKVLARRLHAEAPQTYRDSNHKPEMAVALSDFEALCGFCPHEDIVAALQGVPELRECCGDAPSDAYIASSPDTRREALQAAFTALMTANESTVRACLSKMVSRLEDVERGSGGSGGAGGGPAELSPKERLVLRLNQQYPGDIGVFAVWFLNFITLREGEAMALPANEPHAYLSGEIVECMATSDNVIRAGLTPKMRDTDALCSSLTYSQGAPAVMTGEAGPAGTHLRVYRPPFEEFEVWRFAPPSGAKTQLPTPRGPLMMLVQHGGGVLSSGGGAGRPISRGQVLFVPAGTPLTVTADADTVVWIAAPNGMGF